MNIQEGLTMKFERVLLWVLKSVLCVSLVCVAACGDEDSGQGSGESSLEPDEGMEDDNNDISNKSEECDPACDASEVCVEGACVLVEVDVPDGNPNNEPGCVDDGECSEGEFCQEGVCESLEDDGNNGVSVMCSEQEDCEVGSHRCAGQTIEVCAQDEEGCLRWEAQAVCGGIMVCQDVAPGSAICVERCPDEPCEAGQSRCADGQTVEACVEDEQGCLHWATEQNCSQTQACNDEGDDATCVSPCWRGAYEGSLVVESPEDLELLRDYTTVTGDVRIVEQSGVVDLAPLSCLVRVDGNLSIQRNPDLVSLSGLENLQLVQEDLAIVRNPRLVDLDGLSRLQLLGALLLHANASLDNVDGLSSLRAVGNVVEIERNASLRNLDGFSRLEHIEASLRIEENAILEAIDGFNALRIINVEFSIIDNPMLTHIGGFESLVEIDHLFEIAENPNLITLQGFESVTALERLRINDNVSLCEDEVTAFVSMLQRNVRRPMESVSVRRGNALCEEE